MVQAIQRSLSPTLRERAVRLAGRLCRLADERTAPTSLQQRLWPDSLGFGHAGKALLMAYLAESGDAADRRHWRQRAMRVHRRALGRLSSSSGDVFEGLTGPLWLYEHLRGRLWPARGGGDSMLSRAHRALVDWCGSPDTSAELMSGSGGVALYGLESSRPSRGGDLVAAFLENARRTMVTHEDGFMWPASRRVSSWLVREADAAGDRELATFLRHRTPCRIGMAHGVAGVTVVLASCIVRDRHARTAERLLEGAVGTLVGSVGRFTGPDGSSSIPLLIGLDRPQLQLGWCNGELGVAYALVVAGRAVGHGGWLEHGCDLARQAAQASLARRTARPPILCHGTVGDSHMFRRLFGMTGDRLFADAASRELHRALASLERVLPTGRTHDMRRRSPAPDEVAHGGFLMGLAGAALGVLTAAGHGPAHWDRVLLGMVE